MINFILFTIGISMGAMGGILLKMGADGLGSVNISSFTEGMGFLIKALSSWKVVAGFILYTSSAFVWTYLLTRLDISFVQPILALTYVLTPILAILILGENIPSLRWIGIVIIIFGVYIVSRTA